MVFSCRIVTTHVVRLKLFRLKAEGGRKARLPYFGGNIWFLHYRWLQNALFPNSLQPIHLSSYVGSNGKVKIRSIHIKKKEDLVKEKGTGRQRKDLEIPSGKG
jgi:hypothetical protein